jgi:hypothetical protein
MKKMFPKMNGTLSLDHPENTYYDPKPKKLELNESLTQNVTPKKE